MRYGADHKVRTRERILAQAGRLFRRSGYDGVGVEGLMAAARLTRGGFYGYFRSKAALFAEVIGREPDFVRRMRARTGRSPAQLTAEALEIVAGYLAPENRERVGRGCPMASLSADVARAGPGARAAYEGTVRDLMEEFLRGMPAAPDRERRALATIVLCVGGLVVSRAVSDAALAARIAEACRANVAEQLGIAGPSR
jgi:AcrR family transcriptional regulator